MKDAKKRSVCELTIQKVSNLGSRKVEQVKPHKSNTPEPCGLKTPCNTICSVLCQIKECFYDVFWIWSVKSRVGFAYSSTFQTILNFLLGEDNDFLRD